MHILKTTTFFKRTAAVAAASALVLTGCSDADNADSGAKAGGEKDSGSSAGSAELAGSDYDVTDYDEVKDGGDLVTSLYEVPEQENAFHADMSRPTSTLWAWYNPQLALYDGEGNYSPNPEYITDVTEEEVDGNTVITFTINDKATFNDGTPIDWTAFEATWFANNGKNEGFNVNSTDGYERITKVERGENDKQAVITFDGAYPWWQGLFNMVCHPAMKDPANFNDFVKKIHPEWGAGPYIPETFDFNKGEVIFVRNDKWWGRPGKLDRRIYRQMETQASINAFKNGEIDAAGIASKDRYASVKDMQGIEIRTASMPFSALLEMNAKSEALADKEVRKAIFQAIDRTTLGKIRFNGLPYEETPPGSLTLYPFQDMYQDNFSAAVGDTGAEAAAKTLEGAGFAKGGDGFYAKDGKPLKVRYTLFGDSEVSKATAQAVQKMLKDAGVDATIDQHPSSDFSDVVKNRDFDILPLAFSASDPFGVAYFGQTYRSDSQLNLSNTGTPEFDEKIIELQKLPTKEEQIKRANELETEAFELFGLMPFANGPDIVAQKEGLANFGAMGFAVVPVETVGWKK